MPGFTYERSAHRNPPAPKAYTRVQMAEAIRHEARTYGRERDLPLGNSISAYQAQHQKLEAAARFIERSAKMNLRPQVLEFAEMMEAALCKHDADRGKRGWKHDTSGLLLQCARQAWEELEQAHRDYRSARRHLPVFKECADVANYLMMICDVLNEHGPDGEPR